MFYINKLIDNDNQFIFKKQNTFKGVLFCINQNINNILIYIMKNLFSKFLIL